nr:uncharacterized protein LOC129166610 [Nothobranchius furzeri]
MGPVGFLHVWLLMCLITKGTCLSADGRRSDDDELHRKRAWSFGGISVKTLGLLKSMDSMLGNDVKKVLLEANKVETESSAGHVRLVGLEVETKQQSRERSLGTEDQMGQTVRANSAGATNGVEGSQAVVLKGTEGAAVINGSTNRMNGTSARSLNGTGVAGVINESIDWMERSPARALNGTEGARSLNGTGLTWVINGSIDWMEGSPARTLNGTKGDGAYAKATNGTKGAPAASLHWKEISQAVAANRMEGAVAVGTQG